jgi:hypothetical protein
MRTFNALSFIKNIWEVARPKRINYLEKGGQINQTPDLPVVPEAIIYRIDPSGLHLIYQYSDLSYFHNDYCRLNVPGNTGAAPDLNVHQFLRRKIQLSILKY